MKRMSLFFILFLTAFCCTLTVSAAESAIHNVTIGENTVTVSVTAESDCMLWCAVYEGNDKMFAANAANVNGMADAQTVTLTFDNIPGGAYTYAKAFLLDSETFQPLCACGDMRVFAILYDDGTMVFQHGDTPQTGREVEGTYVVNMRGQYDIPAPWNNLGNSVRVVEFADKIQPRCTTYWFYQFLNLEEIRRIENLDTSNVVSMAFMFHGCHKLTALDLSSFHTPNLVSTHAMFWCCAGLTTLDLSGFDTDKLSSMNYMFYGCSHLTTIYVSENSVIRRATDTSVMFYGCSALVGGNGTTYDGEHIDRTYARIDGGPDNPGYFTAKT